MKEIYDSHLHSHRSHDGRDPLEAICREAERRGIAGIALTDHVDIDLGHAECARVLRAARRDVEACRGGHPTIRVTFGCEIAEMPHDIELSRRLLDDPSIGFVLASLHRLRGESDFYYIDYDRRDRDDIIERYYAELLEIAEGCDFDSLAHINYQVRYMSEKARRATDFSSHYDKLEQVLRRVAERGRGIEVNTSSGKNFADLVPGLDVLKLFKSVGGEVITIGSDAHTARGIGWRMDDAASLIREAGFSRAAFFVDREPIFYDL